MALCEKPAGLFEWGCCKTLALAATATYFPLRSRNMPSDETAIESVE